MKSGINPAASAASSAVLANQSHTQNSGPGNLSRQQRRARERNSDKIEKTLEQLHQTIGIDLQADEVAALIKKCEAEGDFLPADVPKMRETAAAVKSGAIPPVAGYAALIVAWQRGVTAERAVDGLAALFGSTIIAELRAFGPSGGSVSCNGNPVHDRTAMIEFIRQHYGQRNIYFGINPRKPELAGTAKPGNAGDVARRSLIVLDLDNKDAPACDLGWARTVDRLKALRPALVVQSGNGWHVYFRIERQDGLAVEAWTLPLADAMAAIGADNMADPARIIRLPGTINTPTPSKRRRGATLCRASVDLTDKDAPRYQPDVICEEIKLVAQELDLPGRATKSNAAASHSGRQDSLPPEARLSPNVDLLRMALENLPNGEDKDRDHQVAVAHMVRGASKGTEFEADARDLFARWCDKFPGADPDHDAKLWDGIHAEGTGWPHLIALIREENPSAWNMIQRHLEPIRNKAARDAFANSPLDPLQAGLIAPAQPATSTDDDDGSHASEAAGAGAKKNEKPHERALRVAVQHRAEFFTDETGKAWVKLDGRNLSPGGKSGKMEIRGWLARHGIDLTGAAVDAFFDAVESRAYATKSRPMAFRQGQDADKREAYLNLMDGNGTGVRVDEKGWYVEPVANFRVEMADRDKALPMPIPKRSKGKMNPLDMQLKYISLAPVQNANDPNDEGVQQRAGLLTWMLSQLYRPGATPLLFLSGDQGSGKTSAARVLKDHTDPDSAAVLSSLPSDESAVFAFASQQSNLVLDNLSSIRPEHSDVLAQLATGAAYQKRQLYTDGDRVVHQAKCSVIVTAIWERLVRREDLQDRMIAIHLSRLDPAKRRTETDLNAEWEQDKPYVLGAILDALSGALARLPRVKAAADAGLLPPLPRLADAALLAEAAAQYLGWPAGLCIKALNAARNAASSQQLEDNPVAYRIRTLVDQQGGKWSGTAQELADKLRFMDGPEWGRAGNSAVAIGIGIDRAGEPMRQAWGIEINRGRTRKGRWIEISREKYA